jgi:hypothetical protein
MIFLTIEQVVEQHKFQLLGISVHFHTTLGMIPFWSPKKTKQKIHFSQGV